MAVSFRQWGGPHPWSSLKLWFWFVWCHCPVCLCNVCCAFVLADADILKSWLLWLWYCDHLQDFRDTAISIGVYFIKKRVILSPKHVAAGQHACMDGWAIQLCCYKVLRLPDTVVEGGCTPTGFQTPNKKSEGNCYDLKRLTIFFPQCCVPPCPPMLMNEFPLSALGAVCLKPLVKAGQGLTPPMKNSFRSYGL